MSINTKEKPKYLQHFEDVRRQIDAGELQPGDRLPSYADLHKSHGLSQATVERSHALLEKDGYIERLARKGTFVSTPNTSNPNASKEGPANQNLLSNSVVVLTKGAQKSWNYHRQSGWSENITLGALNELRNGSRHAMSLAPGNFQKSDLEYFLQSPPAGAIIIGEPDFTAPMMEIATRLQGLRIPVVMYGNGPELATFDRVISDHEQGSYELTRWLIERGQRRIMRVASVSLENLYWIPMRERGYRRAMSDAGLSPLETCAYPQFSSAHDNRSLFESAARTMANHLAPYFLGDEPVEAIMTITDGDVYVLAAACRLLGKEPNEDVFFVGYDHYGEDSLEHTLESATPLATVDKCNLDLGAALARLLNERIEDGCDAVPQLRLLMPRLVVH